VTTRVSKSVGGKGAALRATVGRRTVLKGAAAAGAILGMGPWIVKDAFSSSGELNILMWSDALVKSVADGFTRKTGIRIKHTPFGSNEELINKMKATGGRGFDLISPTSVRMLQWKPLGLLQPWDMSRVPTERIIGPMLQASIKAGTWDGENHHLPFLWGSEALAWRTDKWSRDYKDLSYGDLYIPQMKGKIMGRAHSMMLAIGLCLDRIGELPSNRMLDTYKDEDTMRGIWDEITKFAIEHKPWLKQFWNDAEAQTRGFTQNGVVLGQTWIGPPLRLKNEGEPIVYMTPQEGALGWIDGLSLPIGAEHTDQVYAFLDYIYTAKVGATLANETSYNSVSVGAEKLLKPRARKNFAEAYPEDALERMWWWPPEAPWYADLRAGYRDKFIAA